jgi:hypothetical protein
MAVMSNRPLFVNFLIQQGAPSPANGMGEMTQECFPGSHDDCLPPEVEADHLSSDLDEDEIGFSDKDPILSIPLWTAAIGAHAPASLKMLGRIDGLAHAAMAHPDTARVASFCSDLSTLREAKKQGLALPGCVDARGRTPAHHAFRQSRTSLTQMKAWATLCPEWMGAHAKGLGTPIDVARKSRGLSADPDALEEAIAEIDAIVLRASLKGARAEPFASANRAKAVPAKKRRPRRL